MAHVTHDHLYVDGGVVRFPAVVVGRHAEQAVGNFGFAEERGFRAGGHVDAGDVGEGAE